MRFILYADLLQQPLFLLDSLAKASRFSLASLVYYGPVRVDYTRKKLSSTQYTLLFFISSIKLTFIYKTMQNRFKLRARPVPRAVALGDPTVAAQNTRVDLDPGKYTSARGSGISDLIVHTVRLGERERARHKKKNGDSCVSKKVGENVWFAGPCIILSPHARIW